ncbi:hypothetical protein QBC38DRAFT_446271 [Podospora fimiseda]|uniref:Ketoreductase domain-containing protein n=1 Tax=Podospora fimiseda TaxID=252190 RepID=A0AAN7GUI4_9PEZI|nr:hypothetical protein QBC38DRAFT_446271 [Podospora fimiseda]
MAAPQPSYTKKTYSSTYPAISPTLPALSSAGKVILVTGATGGIGRATSLSFAASSPKALILLGRRGDALAETASLVHANFPSVTISTHQVDLLNSPKLRSIFSSIVETHGPINTLIHAAGVLAPVVPLINADPSTFLDGYKTTVVGTLSLAQALVLSNPPEHPSVLVNLTTAGIFFPPFAGMGAYVSSKMAAVKLLQAFGAENPFVRINHVHPGLLDTDMSRELFKSVKLPFGFDDISLPADSLVWIASDEGKFLNGKIVFAAWDVEELKEREKEIVGQGPFGGELGIGYSGFPRLMSEFMFVKLTSSMYQNIWLF